VPIDDGFRRVGSDPFALPVEERDPIRRLRGRLPMPVTIWTAYGEGDLPAGITVSSVLVEEGESPYVLGLVAPDSSFWDAVRLSKRFVVHILDGDQSRIADQFALRYPGDPFEAVSIVDSPHGPVLSDVGSRSACSLAGYLEGGFSLVLRGSIDEVQLDENPSQPLVHYRGRYFTAGVKT
jgi:3-hydroxy-9,10-secoandrosta-1,3,5(10)-triene-9,17-dione monooxygenase reductase component